MSVLMNGRSALLRFYSRFDTYLSAALKFGVAFFALFHLCSSMGYMEALEQPLVIFIIAAFCSFLPGNALILAGAVYLEGQFYGCSLETGIVGGILLLIFLLLYFCFIPRQAYAVILTALCISLKIPLAVPVVCALLMGPGACVGILFGTVVYYTAHGLGQGGQEPVGLSEELLNRILELFRTLFLQEELVLSLVILTAVFFVVYLIRRMPMKYCWSIAVISGVVVYILLWGMGSFLLKTAISPGWFVADLLLGAASGCAVQFFCFALDYGKVRYLQFEDDDYYYYVKAVPKLGNGDRENAEEEGTIENE